MQAHRVDDPSPITHAIVIACLNLQHETKLRAVGEYAGIVPDKKDTHGSMLRVMKGYARAIRAMASGKTEIRSAPDPNKALIQHHLLRSRQLAGPDPYILVAYNGHGIQEPPTEAGELWSFDRSFEECTIDGTGPSEYIPLLCFDLLSWAGPATAYIWDVNNAGRLVKAAQLEAAEIDRQLTAAAAADAQIAISHPALYSRQVIHFAACSADEVLPRFTGMPEDLFTTCLLSPLKIALLYHNEQIFPRSNVDSGKQKSAVYMKTLWTGISEQTKSHLTEQLIRTVSTTDLFAQLGEMIEKLAAGFILAQRVMGVYHVHPVSKPPIPRISTNRWLSWDLVMQNFFEQLPERLEDDPAWERRVEFISYH